MTSPLALVRSHADHAARSTARAETRKTILFVTHDIDEAVLLSDRIYAMAARPSSVREVVEVALPRPRHREDPEFVRLSRHLSSLLE
jgi:ABC-type nitrate/sulfonate/bicarbonate transport system ATPase subunit